MLLSVPILQIWLPEFFSVLLRNRLISGLKPVILKKTAILENHVSYYSQFSTNIKVKIIK